MKKNLCQTINILVNIMKAETLNSTLWTEMTDSQSEVVNGGGGCGYEEKKKSDCYSYKPKDYCGSSKDDGCSSDKDYGCSDDKGC
jgi:hypothetical protein